jgi:hypothetical protein
MKYGGKIALIALIWLAVILQLFINHDLKPAGDVVEAFSSSEAVPVEAVVSCYGEFGDMMLAKATKETMLVNLAKKLGITDGYEVTESEGTSYQETTLTKDGKYGKTVLQIVSMDTENVLGDEVTRQSIVCEVTIYDDLEYAMNCKEAIETMYSELGMDAMVNIYFKGKTAGDLSTSERKKLTDEMLEVLNATEVQTIENENFTSVYGYASQFKQSIQQNGTEINVNLAYTYNETEDTTYIHLAVPYIAQSY